MPLADRVKRLERMMGRVDGEEPFPVCLVTRYGWPEDRAKVAEELEEGPAELEWGEDEQREVSSMAEVDAALVGFVGKVTVGPTSAEVERAMARAPRGVGVGHVVMRGRVP